MLNMSLLYLVSILQYLSWIATGTGVLFATIFYIGTKEPRKTRERKPSAYIDMVRNLMLRSNPN